MSNIIEIGPSYNDFFRGDVPEINDLLKDIPSKLIIATYSIVMAELEKNGEELSVQKRIWNSLSEYFPNNLKIIVDYTIFNRNNKTNSTYSKTLFTKFYVMEFIQYILQNYIDVTKQDTSEQDEINIFKAYIVLVEKIHKNDELKFRTNISFTQESIISQDDKSNTAFQQITWPFILKQHALSRKANSQYEILKGIQFYLFLQQEYPNYLKKYLELNSVDSFWEILGIFLYCIDQNSKNTISLNGFELASPFLENLDDRFKKIIEPHCLDENKINSILEKDDLKKFNDFLLMREFPIFKSRIREENIDDYLTLNKEFLKEKIFKALIFDFYRRSGIASTIKSLPDFLNKKATLFTENRLFKSLIENTFHGKYNVVIFDENQEDGMADCYIRLGKYVLLLELKDSLMPANTIEQREFSDIINDIKSKFISNTKGKAKGVGQLINNIYKLNNSPFNYDNFEKRGFKRNKIIIIPIIVYTDFNYSLSGIQDLLRKEFRNKMEVGKTLNLGGIEDLILMDLETFFDLISHNLQKHFIDFCLDYNSRIRKLQKHFIRNRTPDNDFKCKEIFELFLVNKLKSSKSKLDFIKICQKLNIELPKS